LRMSMPPVLTGFIDT